MEIGTTGSRLGSPGAGPIASSNTLTNVASYYPTGNVDANVLSLAIGGAASATSSAASMSTGGSTFLCKVVK